MQTMKEETVTSIDNKKVVPLEWTVTSPPTTNTLLYYDYLYSRHLFHTYSNLIPQLVTSQNKLYKNLFTLLWKILAISNDGFFHIALLPVLYFGSIYFETKYSHTTTTTIWNYLFTKYTVKFYYYACLIDVIVVGSIKMSVRRVRPSHNPWFFVSESGTIRSKLDVGPDQYSLPSGHASRGMMINVLSVYWFLYVVPVNYYMSALCLLLLVTIWNLTVALSRVCLGRHFISDVLLGLFLGGINAFLAITIKHHVPLVQTILNIF
jgi:membrane-associated phospholipid phosphatase